MAIHPRHEYDPYQCARAFYNYVMILRGWCVLTSLTLEYCKQSLRVVLRVL